MTDKTSSKKEITFKCHFCGQERPLSEMSLQNRFFPQLAACLECERQFQSLKPVDEQPDEIAEEEPAEDE